MNDFPNIEHACMISGWHHNINGYRCFMVDRALPFGFSGQPSNIRKQVNEQSIK
jgi:hypothetical protein